MPTAPRIYVDSADRDVVVELLRARLVHGVTTNPTILERDGARVADIPALYAQWVEAGAAEVFFQTWGATAAQLLANAEGIRALGDRVAVKVPATRDGFAAARALADDGAVVLVTAVYSVGQALAAAACGARYIAPYVGRLRDAGRDAIDIVARMQAVCAGSATDVLAASLRSVDDIVALRLAGVPYFTAAPAVIDALLRDDVSDLSAADFESAIARISG